MNLKKRMYEDYFKKSRLPEYRRTLQVAKKHGYKMVGVLNFAKLVHSNGLAGQKIYLNRHDIDTSPKVAAKMFSIEKEIYGKDGSATYYFRDTTIDKKLIKEIDEYGYETGYHYEELASLAKKNKLKSLNEIVEIEGIAAQQFLLDLKWFRMETGSKSLSVASHGDFINTLYDVQNYEILKQSEVRNKAGIVVEAYDEFVMQYVLERYADQELLENYTERVTNAFKRGCSVVMTLTHPRNWEIDISANTMENWRRLLQGVRYRYM